MKLKGKTAIVTGANQGFGLAAAKALLVEGARVIICARDEHLLNNARKELDALSVEKNQVLHLAVDVTQAKQIDRLVEITLDQIGRIDIVIANAGIYGPKGKLEDIDWDEWSHAIDINLKGTVLTCRAVLPHMKRNRSGKIIILSGGGATKPMPYLSAYAASKAAVVRFSETLAEEVKSFNIDVNALAPGALNTRLLDETLAAGPEIIGHEFYQQCLQQKKSGGTSLEIGASLCVFLASAESDGITGKLISAVWDPWQSFPELKSELVNSDIYTLRRIVPQDRAKNWESK